MGRRRLSKESDDQLNTYRYAAVAASKILDTVINKHVSLMRKRSGLLKSPKLTAEKRREWNSQAAQWRNDKVAALQQARAAHQSAYEDAKKYTTKLKGSVEEGTFWETFNTVNGYFSRPDADLRRRKLEDL